MYLLTSNVLNRGMGSGNGARPTWMMSSGLQAPLAPPRGRYQGLGPSAGVPPPSATSHPCTSLRTQQPMGRGSLPAQHPARPPWSNSLNSKHPRRHQTRLDPNLGNGNSSYLGLPATDGALRLFRFPPPSKGRFSNPASPCRRQSRQVNSETNHPSPNRRPAPSPGQPTYQSTPSPHSSHERWTESPRTTRQPPWPPSLCFLCSADTDARPH